MYPVDMPNPQIGYSRLSKYRNNMYIGQSLTPLCDCGEEETTEHYILHCHIYDHERAKLAVQLETIDESLDLLHLLTRDSNKEKHQNKLTFLEEFIKSTGRFPELASPVP